MLEITEATLAVADHAARPAFAEAVRVLLADKYPHFLPRFPAGVQAAIVGNMLGRASGWGLARQDALTAFCEFMIAIGAEFDAEPEIAAVLERHRGRLDLLVPTLPDHVSEAAWDRAEAASSMLPFFVAPDHMSAPPDRRSAEAFRLVAGDRPEAADPVGAVARAAPLVRALGLGEVPDALLVCAVAQAFYGERPAWTAALAAERWGPRAAVEAIRLRLAVDFGRVA